MRELKQKTQKKETYAEKTKKYEKENFEDNVPLEIGKRNLERNSEWQLGQETQSENCKKETQMKDKIKKLAPNKIRTYDLFHLLPKLRASFYVPIMVAQLGYYSNLL